MKRTTAATAAAALVAAVLTLASPSAAGAAPSPATALVAQEQADLIVEAGAESALVLTRYDGGEATAAASGDRTAGSPVDARPDDRFRAGSVSKTLVATVVLQLWEEGAVELDGALGDHLPGVLPYADAVTLRQLLQHTGGVPDYVDLDLLLDLVENPDQSSTPDQLLQRIAALPRAMDRIGTYTYSSSNYVLLGRLVEHVTGQPLDLVLNERVLEPAGMRHTSFPQTPRVAGPHVHGYLPTSHESSVDVTHVNPSWAWAAGDLVTTTTDVARFTSALFSGKLLGQAALREMQTTVPTGLGSDYGLGVTRWDFPCGGVAWGHSGSTLGYTTYVMATSDAAKQLVTVVPLTTEALPGHPVEGAHHTALGAAWCAE